MRRRAAPAAAVFSRTALLLALAAAALAPGCGAPAGDDGPPPLETEEVTPPPDAGLTWEDDPRAAPPAAEDAAGVLPSGYPAEIPLYRPASIVDMEQRADGSGYVEIVSPSPPEAVADHFESVLRGAGWRRGGSGKGGASSWSRGGRVLEVSMEADGAGSRARIEFFGG